MESLILMLVVGIIVGSVVWNHWQQRQAAEGVSFVVPRPPQDVEQFIGSLYCHGAKAKARSAVFRVFVRPAGPGRFEVSTRIGDQGEIRVVEEGGRSRVTAQIHQVHIGQHPMTVSNRASWWGLSSRLANMYRVVFRLSTYAGRLNRFQKGVERKVTRRATSGAPVAR